MEEWQQAHITKNLTKLASMTKCNAPLLAFLRSKNILTYTELEMLGLQTETDTCRVYRLYNIVKTRRNGFEELKNALESTLQTGALDILNSCSEDCDDYNKYERIVCDDKPIDYIGSSVTIYTGTFGDRPAIIKLFDGSRKLENAKNELKLLTTLDWHINVARCFLGKYLLIGDRQQFAVVSEFQTNLEKYIKANKILSRKWYRNCIRDVLSGITFLHVNGVLHLNLKPVNIFIHQRHKFSMQVKIGELGLSRQICPEETTVSISMGKLHEYGAASFYTPEVISAGDGLESERDFYQTNVDLTFNTDLFSLGIVVYYILSCGSHAAGPRPDRLYNIPRGLMQTKRECFQGHSISESSETTFLNLFSTDPLNRTPINALNKIFKKL